jgi:hypothetical protein
LQKELAVRQSDTSLSADVGRAGDRAINTDQQARASSSDLNIITSIDGANGSYNSACHDRSSVISPTVTTDVSNNVNVTSEGINKNMDLSELTLPLFTDSSKQVPLHFIRDLDLYFKLKYQTI